MKPQTPQRKITLREIAEVAGVSKVTVSGALRGDPGAASTETRAHIREVAARLGYVPDPRLGQLMSHLRQSRRQMDTPTLVVVNPAKDRSYTRAEPHNRLLIEGAGERAREFGYHLEELWLKQPGMTTRRFNQILNARGVDGVIVPVLNTLHLGHMRLEWDRISVVSATVNLHPSPHAVSPDHYQHMGLAFRHLRMLGYRRIGLVETRDLHPKTQSKWLAALLLETETHSEQARIPALVAPSLAELRKGFGAWLRREKPDVLVSPYNFLPEWLADEGFRVPKDIGFCSLFVLPDQKHSGIDQHSARVGAAAVDLLTGMIHRHEKGLPASPTLLSIPGEWCDGNSLRPSER